MRRVFVEYALTISVFFCGCQPNSGNDPCLVELPRFAAATRWNQIKEQKEIDAGTRRHLGKDVTLAEIESLLPLKDKLKHLRIVRRKLGEAELKVLSQLRVLESLNLSDCEITDADFESLQPCLFTVKTLWMTRCPLSDRSMPIVADMTSLIALGLHGSEITDAGLKHIARRLSLATLDIGGTSVSDAGIGELVSLRDLDRLSIGHNPKLTNAAVASLTSLEKLTSLQIDSTSINEECLDHLVKFKNLRFVHSGGLGFSPEALGRLAKQLPKYGKFDNLYEDVPVMTYYRLECVDGWDYAKLKQNEKAWEAVMQVTRDVPLPTDAENIHAVSGPFGQDSKQYLIFQSAPKGINEFVAKMLEDDEKKLSTATASNRLHMDCDKSLIDAGFPWLVDDFNNGKFSRIPRSNGGLLVDTNQNRVYLSQ